MNERLWDYLQRQKQFWNVQDMESAIYKRIYLAQHKTYQEDATEVATTVLDGIVLPDNATILEIGCGVGRVIEQLVQRITYGNIIGVDIAENMVKFARENLKHVQNSDLYTNDGRSLPMIEDSAVDFAYSVDVFIHICDIDVVLSYLREIRRVLRPEGLFRFNVRSFHPSRSFANTPGGAFAKMMYLLGVWSAGWNRWDAGRPAEFNGNQYMKRDIRKLAKRTGFRAVGIHDNEDKGMFWCTFMKQLQR